MPIRLPTIWAEIDVEKKNEKVRTSICILWVVMPEEKILASMDFTS